MKSFFAIFLKFLGIFLEEEYGVGYFMIVYEKLYNMISITWLL